MKTGNVVDDDGADHDKLEARGPAPHSQSAIVSSLTTLTAMSFKCYLLNILDPPSVP